MESPRCSSCAALEAEANRLAELCALQGAAAVGHLQPGHPYAGKPLAPVEEVLRMRRAMYHLARMAEEERAAGRFDVDDNDIGPRIKMAEELAAKEIPIAYAGVKVAEIGGGGGGS
jgi:malate synthase